MNVLVVDDNPQNIQIVGNILLENKLNLAFATDGKKALELSANNDFDLILLDIMMPGMDGFEVCRSLRRSQKTAETPIIFLTAKTDNESIIKGFEAGANDYVTKPFNSAELTARVKTHLELNSKRKQLDGWNKLLESKVQLRTQQLEEANKNLVRIEKSKSDFLSIISHELRNPLTELVGLNALMQMTPLNEEQMDYIRSMQHSADRLARFSEMALLITTLQAGSSQPDLFPLVVKILFNMAIHELQYSIKEKEIQITIDCKPDDILVVGDADLIRKCLVLLIGNAMNHLPGRGKVALSAAQLNEHEVCLQVSDNGNGFDASFIALFNEVNLNDPLPTRYSWGLSLTAVKLMMEAQGGRLNIENNPNGGAKVSLVFMKHEA